MSKKYFLHSLGCKVNSYETAALGIDFQKHQWKSVERVEEADIVVLNTCSVTGRADQKSRQHISSFRKRNPNAILVVMGCYSQKHAKESVALGANIVVGTAGRSKIVDYIAQFEKEGKAIADVKADSRKEKYEELGSNAFCENSRAFLKVQDGCDNFCSYCYIPFLRGNSRSREPRAVLEEAKALVEAGYKEIVLTGIETGSYGRDLGDGSYRLPDLMEGICTKIPELPRLRISSIEESEIDDRFLDVLKRYPVIVDHLHIPLQSGSASVLKRMKRHYGPEEFASKIERIRQIRPEIAITTDVIAGFPGESDEEWKETMDFCSSIGFAEIHVFPFSMRPGTFAATLKDTDPKVKKARVRDLLELSKGLRLSYEKRFWGRQVEILIENTDEENGFAYGHTPNYLLCRVPLEHHQHGDLVSIIYKSEISSD